MHIASRIGGQQQTMRISLVPNPQTGPFYDEICPAGGKHRIDIFVNVKCLLLKIIWC